MKNIIFTILFACTITLSGCNNMTASSVGQVMSEKTDSSAENADSQSLKADAAIVETDEIKIDSNTSVQESPEEDNKSEISDDSDVSNNTDSILDSFLDGEMEATYPENDDSFYITDLDMSGEDVFSYSIGERLDLDNDGDNELILSNPDGGLYLDVLDGKVVVLAENCGRAAQLSYVFYDDAYWIIISDTSHAGRSLRQFTRYSGSDTVVDEFNLDAEYWDQDRYDENSDFSYRNKSITMQEYEDLCGEIFGLECAIRTRGQKYYFDSYDEIISLLKGDEAYALVKIAGYDGDVLLVTENVYDNLDGNLATISVVPFTKKNDGMISSDKEIHSIGTAYPLAIDDKGLIYCCGHHNLEAYCYDTDEYDQIKLTLAKSLSEDEDADALDKAFDEYWLAKIINFTAIDGRTAAPQE